MRGFSVWRTGMMCDVCSTRCCLQYPVMSAVPGVVCSLMFSVGGLYFVNLNDAFVSCISLRSCFLDVIFFAILCVGILLVSPLC